ncbi:MAG: autotransporter domain-containing protein [Opitutaceae bacterium]|nr:autotransporter domain-containing protein [Opitutaceae bacterium]
MTRKHKPRKSIFAKWAALLATIGGMAALPFNTMAANKLVSTGEDIADPGPVLYDNDVNAHAVQVAVSGTYNGTNIRVTSTVNARHGVYTTGGNITLSSGTVTASGSNARGIYILNSSTVTALVSLNQLAIKTTGELGHGLYVSASSVATGTSVTVVTGSLSYGIFAAAAGTIELAQTSITTTDGYSAVGAMSGGVITLRNTSITASGSYSSDNLTDGVSTSSGATITLIDSTVITAGGCGLRVANSSANHDFAIINMTGGSISTGTGAALQLISGTMETHGQINVSQVTIDSGALYQTNNKNPDNDISIAIRDSDISNAGGIELVPDNNGTHEITVSGGSGITGDVTNSGSGALTVTLDRTTARSNITNNGGGSTTISLNNDSHGTGGWNGGSLSLIDNESTWNFSGTNSVLDNVRNDGTIIVDVNTDTGAGGSITVTGTAGGAGTVHIDTTGNGTLHPDDALKDKVAGDGTENWVWDPIDWGLETVLKDGENPDGTSHFRIDGASAAGAVLNSAVVLQQALWFAQQDSLHKRLGDLRLSPSSAGDSFVSNLWMRAHAQRLNLDSAVAGRSAAQTLYGIDIGADKPWKLDTGSAATATLHTGLYLGHGQSTADYKTPGAEAELTTTHAGLYATYLRDNGFYADAVLKIASVENTLEAPSGATLLKADYKNLNLGASIEIGYRCPLQNDWYIEPQLQLGYLHVFAKNYTAAAPAAPPAALHIAAADMDALQARLTHTLGKTLRLANGSVLQPYARLGGAVLTSTGGEIRNGYQRLRPNIDGTRLEAGAGILWQLGAAHQLHLDYEASYAEDYTKPWGLTAGYRFQF